MMFKTSLLLTLLSLTAQAPRIDALVAAVRPVLPYPAASPDGELPADNSTASRWFVVWPAGPVDTRIVVKANPLHPETQKAGAQAMDQINAAVAAAERRAQDAYDKAIEQLRRTGKGSELEAITLDDLDDLWRSVERAAQSVRLAHTQPIRVLSSRRTTP